MFLPSYAAKGGRTLIPLAHFAPNPALDVELRLETDLAKLPQELRARVMIPTADEALRRQLEARGFFVIEGTAQAYLMERQFPDGVLVTDPAAFSAHHDDSIPYGTP